MDRHEPNLSSADNFQYILPRANLVEICSVVLEMKSADRYISSVSSFHVLHTNVDFIILTHP